MELKLATNSQKQAWVLDYVKEYVSESGFLPYMGSSTGSIIRVRNELKNGGSLINVPLVMALDGTGVTGSQVLSGNEDDMGNANDQVRVNYIRNAVKVTKNESFKTELDLLGAAKDRLRSWASSKLRADIVTALGSQIVQGTVDSDGFSTDTAVAYGDATASQKNAHLVANTDRTYFLGGSGSSGVQATALATVDATNGKWTAAKVGIAIRKAKATRTGASISITPYKSDATAGREWYVLFVDSIAFRDLSADSTIITANQNARERDVNTNPVFQGGDLIYNGVIIREIPELDTLALTGVGGSSTDVGIAFLCGLSAVTVAWGQQPQLVSEEMDYAFRKGIGTEEIRGVKKTSFNGVQYGVVTCYHNRTAD